MISRRANRILGKALFFHWFSQFRDHCVLIFGSPCPRDAAKPLKNVLGGHLLKPHLGIFPIRTPARHLFFHDKWKSKFPHPWKTTIFSWKITFSRIRNPPKCNISLVFAIFRQPTETAPLSAVRIFIDFNSWGDGCAPAPGTFLNQFF